MQKKTRIFRTAGALVTAVALTMTGAVGASASVLDPMPTICKRENVDGVKLKQGARGDKVVYLQCLLFEHSFMPDDQVDGVFGPKTLAAVKEFQAFKGLEVDGVVGPKTWAALE